MKGFKLIRLIVNGFLLLLLTSHYSYAFDINIINSKSIITSGYIVLYDQQIWKDGPITVSYSKTENPITVDFHALVNSTPGEKQGSMRFYHGDKLKTYYYPTNTILEKNLSGEGKIQKDIEPELEKTLKSNRIPKTLPLDTIKIIFAKILNKFEDKNL